ncbi:MAG: hypothetical protein QM737_01395 [Ferruginibacter sp.]
MTTETIVKRISEKYSSTRLFTANVNQGHLSVNLIASELKFDIVNVEPKNTEDVLDWFSLTKKQIIEVVNLITNRDQTQCIEQFIIENKLNEDKGLWLVPYLDPMHTRN